MASVSAVSSRSNSEAMKKLYRKGVIVHPPPTNQTGHPALITAALLALSFALSPEDREVLSYLMSVSSKKVVDVFNQPQHQSGESTVRTFYTGDHPTTFSCDCFSCYVVYWKRFTLSPNIKLLNEIMEGFEDWFEQFQNCSSTNNSSIAETKTKLKSKKKAKKGGRNSGGSSQSEQTLKKKLTESDSETVTNICSGCGDGSGGRREMEEAGSMEMMMSFIGERVLRVWRPSP